MKTFIICILLLFVAPCFTGAHPGEYGVVVDTDGGLDDYRAINLLLATHEVEILAVTTTDGVLAPGVSAQKVGELLGNILQTVPIAKGEITVADPPACRTFCQGINWYTGEPVLVNIKPDAVNLLHITLSDATEPVLIICLGPLTNIAALLQKHPEHKNKIEKIIWYNQSVEPPKGLNYELDKASADFVLSLNLTIDLISNNDNPASIIVQEFLDSLKQISTLSALRITDVFYNDSVKVKMAHQHLRFWDDLVPVYLFFPEFFDMTPDFRRPNIHIAASVDFDLFKTAYLDILRYETVPDKQIVFQHFSWDRNAYRYDIQPYVDEIIKKHGEEEWRACLITNEMHGHLGIYSLIGAKMGIKAREIFNVGIDQISVESFAGSSPPISCLNDGIQVSTGATLGQGTITVLSDTLSRPEAIFRYKGSTIDIRLKKEYREIVKNDINHGIITYGLQDSGYWRMVRKLAIKYWREWSRDEIFDIVHITN